MPHTEAIRNWRLLEGEIVRVLEREGLKIEKNGVGDPCVGEDNIAKLAQTLSPRVLTEDHAAFGED